MTALQAQQRALLQAVCAEREAALPLLKQQPDGGPARLSIYRHAYRARLVAALADNYTVLQRALGDEAFEALGLAYVEAHPSQQPSIRWFGHRLAEFMAARDDLVPHPALVDFARMDWALRDAFDAADAPVLALAALAALPAEAWGELRLQPHPSLRLLTLDWNIEPAWRALREHDPESGTDEPELPEPQAHRHGLAVWRQGLETRWRSLPALEAQLLPMAVDGASFAVLCEQAALLLGDEAQAAAAAVQALQQWVCDGLFRTVTGNISGMTAR
jgi:hypothetical protein